jgi:hypothetical protein
VGASFIEYRSGIDALELFYIVIDIGFILGHVGFYILYRDVLVGVGRFGLILSLCGFGLIAGPEAKIFGIGIYQIGSPIIGVGILLLSIGIIRSRIVGYVAPILLGLSIFVGLGSMIQKNMMLFAVSGVLFGAGFIALGVSMWSTANKSSMDSPSFARANRMFLTERRLRTSIRPMSYVERRSGPDDISTQDPHCSMGFKKPDLLSGSSCVRSLPFQHPLRIAIVGGGSLPVEKWRQVNDVEIYFRIRRLSVWCD